jgi:hypothetical protein
LRNHGFVIGRPRRLDTQPPGRARVLGNMPQDDEREPPTTRQPRRRTTTTTITVYRTETSGWQLTRLPSSIAVEADLAEGFHVAKADDGLRIFDRSGTLSMTADEAVRARVLEIPMFERAVREQALRMLRKD